MRQKTAVLILSRNSDEDGSSETCPDMNTADAVSKYSATDDMHVNTDNRAEERRDNTRDTTGLTLLTLIFLESFCLYCGSVLNCINFKECSALDIIMILFYTCLEFNKTFV